MPVEMFVLDGFEEVADWYEAWLWLEEEESVDEFSATHYEDASVVSHGWFSLEQSLGQDFLVRRWTLCRHDECILDPSVPPVLSSLWWLSVNVSCTALSNPGVSSGR